MRRIFMVLLCLLMLAGCCFAAEGSTTQIAEMKTEIVVGEDSTCSVTNQFVVAFSGHDQEFLIPMGADATDSGIGLAAEEVERNGVTCYLLTNTAGFAGQQNLVVTYRLPAQAVAADDGTQGLDLSVLAPGFPCPIEKWTITVTFPKDLEGTPGLISGSHGDTAFNDFQTSVQGSVFTAQLLGKMNENDSLRLTMDMAGDYFNLSELPGGAYVPGMIGFYILAALALVYWVIKLRNPIVLAKPRKMLPANVTAGELGCHLTNDKPDIASLIMQWAELGYLSIHRTARGRLVLVREMEMGNERRPVESKLFAALFRKGSRCDVHSVRYRNAAKRMERPFRAQCNARMFHKKSGQVIVMQLLGILASMAVGICAFDAFFGMFTARWLLVALFSVSFGVLAWHIQQAVIGLLRRKPLRSGVRAAVLVLIIFFLGKLGGLGFLGVMNVLLQLAIGGLTAFGGRRSADGIDLLAQLMGYRRNLRTQSTEEIAQLHRQNPSYFYINLAYAEAGGVAHGFVKQCGDLELERCDWLHGWKNIPTDPAGFYGLYCSVAAVLRQEDGPGFWENLLRNLSGRRRRAREKKAGRHAAPRRARTEPSRPTARSAASRQAEPHVRSHRRTDSAQAGPEPVAAGHVRPHRRRTDEPQ